MLPLITWYHQAKSRPCFGLPALSSGSAWFAPLFVWSALLPLTNRLFCILPKPMSTDLWRILQLSLSIDRRLNSTGLPLWPKPWLRLSRPPEGSLLTGGVLILKSRQEIRPKTSLATSARSTKSGILVAAHCSQGVLYSASILVLISCLISLIGALPFKKIPASINKSAPFCALVVSLLLWVCIVVVVAFSVTASDLCRDALLFRNNVTQFPNNTAQYS